MIYLRCQSFIVCKSGAMLRTGWKPGVLSQRFAKDWEPKPGGNRGLRQGARME